MTPIAALPGFLFFLLLTVSPLQAQNHLLLDGGRLIDGTGRAPIDDIQILIKGNRIERVGTRGSFEAPAGARRIDTAGKTILPGFVDPHFHIADDVTMVPLFVANGVTAARDPGAWMELFEPVKEWQQEHSIPAPRLFLCGPHLDGPNPAYPTDSIVILSPEEARLAVRRQVAQGATAIKVYFRLPLESIRAAADEAHRLRVPVTAHLEVIDARDAVEAGIDGVEHITSLGTALIPPMEAEKYRQQILADNGARREGRYRMWASIDPHAKPAADLARFLAERKIFVDPNLAVFERRSEANQENNDIKVRATKNMKEYVGALHRAGVPIVAGSHSNARYAPRGFAFHREMETLVEAGLTPMETLVAATKIGAEFFQRQNDLGTVEEGKLADILVLDRDPLASISNTRSISTIVIDGRVIDPNTVPPLAKP